ncbi:hypothetical protein BKA63DRAFT_587428 [Paraphoma chrysanthemicola]|nr:hypothetical protein BKA63DRAFT_587428 [Paraphoma chrysanthemicola]
MQAFSGPLRGVKDRLGLITVNSRLANKVLNAHLHALDKLDLDSAGVRGEMGHMVVELRAMDVLVWHAISQATVHHEEFKRSKHGVAPEDITEPWLQQAIKTGNSLVFEVLHDATYYLALRILQPAASLGLDKFIIVGGFARRPARTGAYLQVIQGNLARLCHGLRVFCGWNFLRMERGSSLSSVQPGLDDDDDDDGLIGMGYFVQHMCAHHRAVEISIGQRKLAVTTRRIPDCGAHEFLPKVVDIPMKSSARTWDGASGTP